ncbi:MAG TPA: hypothetical protein PKE57_07960 [Cellvibrionaceae bacterium]|nr:hypothetical protein [Cellvibrionaceae bacterium]
MVGDAFLNDVHGELEAAFFVQNLAEEILNAVHAKLTTDQAGVGRGAKEGAFEPADVRADAVGEELEDFVGEVQAHLPGFFPENREAHFHVGRLEVSRQAPLEAGRNGQRQLPYAQEPGHTTLRLKGVTHVLAINTY